MIICLTGCMGCGKSSVGRRLAGLLAVPFIDLDDYIEECEQRSITEIFDRDGESAFRAIEAAALRRALDEAKESKVVLALGGGTVMNPVSAGIIKDNTTCIYLRSSAQTLEKHVGDGSGRPVLKTKSIAQILAERGPVYESVAHYTLDCDGLTPIQAARAISALLSRGCPSDEAGL